MWGCMWGARYKILPKVSQGSMILVFWARRFRTWSYIRFIDIRKVSTLIKLKEECKCFTVRQWIIRFLSAAVPGNVSRFFARRILKLCLLCEFRREMKLEKRGRFSIKNCNERDNNVEVSCILFQQCGRNFQDDATTLWKYNRKYYGFNRRNTNARTIGKFCVSNMNERELAPPSND